MLSHQLIAVLILMDGCACPYACRSGDETDESLIAEHVAVTAASQKDERGTELGYEPPP